MLGFNAAHTGLSPNAGPAAPAQWKWSYTPDPYFFDSSPAIGADGTIYAYARIQLYAFRPDGTVRWTCATAESGVAASPALASDGTIYLATGNGTLYAIDPTTGSEKWHFTGVGYPSATTVGGDGTIYFGTDLAVFGSDTNWAPEGAGHLYAVNSDGALKWAVKTGRIKNPPAIGSDGTVYLASLNGYLYALDPATGSRKWTFWRGAGLGDISLSSSVAPDGTIYLGDPWGYLTAVNPDGTEKWMLALTSGGARNTGLTSEWSALAIAGDGTIYVEQDIWSMIAGENDEPFGGRLYAVDPDGSQKWTFATSGPSGCAPIVDSEGVVYITVSEPNPSAGGVGGLYAISPDGSIKWSFTASRGPSGSPFTPAHPVIARDGTMYIGSWKELYAFGGPIHAPTVTITSFTPSSGPVGTRVFLTGKGLTDAPAVAFNGAPADHLEWPNPAITRTLIIATVPTGATTGPITVTTPSGSATSATSFTVTSAPVTAAVTLNLGGLTTGALTLGQTVTATGTVAPQSLVGSRVVLSVQMKTGASWVKVKTTTASTRPVGKFSWKYRPAAKGTYRMRAQITKTATSGAATSSWLAFTVR